MQLLAEVSMNAIYLGEALLDLTPEEEVAYYIWRISHADSP